MGRSPAVRRTCIAQDAANRSHDPNMRPDREAQVLQGILGAQPACYRCPLRHKRKVLPDGPVPARIAIVGEEPGRQEERKGRGFVGPSGDVLWSILGPRVGLRREEIWVTNAALCRAEDVELASGAWLPKEEVKKEAAKFCRYRLLTELAIVDPVVVIPVGNYALSATTGLDKASIYKYRGSIQEIDFQALADDFARRSHPGIIQVPKDAIT